MNKLFSFSKIASIATILLLILKLFIWNLTILSTTIEIANNIILIILFSYIYKLSKENSILKKPSLIGISSMSIFILIIILNFFLYSYEVFEILSEFFSFAIPIGLFITFFFYSKFEKNKLKKIIYLIYPSIVILGSIFSLFAGEFYHLIEENYDSIIASSFLDSFFKSFYIIENISLAIFYYTFSKIYNK